MASRGSRSAIAAPPHESGAASRSPPPLFPPLLRQALAMCEIALSLTTWVKVPRIKAGTWKGPCCSRKVRVSWLRARTTCWWVFLLAFLLPIPRVYSTKDLAKGNCPYDLASVAALSCMQPNGALRPPSLTCCKALLYAIDHVPAIDQSGACCLCRYIRDKQRSLELARAYVLCKGKDRHIVKKWSSLPTIKCSGECRKRRNSSPHVGIAKHKDRSLADLHNTVKANGIFWSLVVISILIGLICFWYIWRFKLAANASELGGPQADRRGSPGCRPSTKPKRKGRKF